MARYTAANAASLRAQRRVQSAQVANTKNAIATAMRSHSHGSVEYQMASVAQAVNTIRSANQPAASSQARGLISHEIRRRAGRGSSIVMVGANTVGRGSSIIPVNREHE